MATRTQATKTVHAPALKTGVKAPKLSASAVLSADVIAKAQALPAPSVSDVPPVDAVAEQRRVESEAAIAGAAAALNRQNEEQATRVALAVEAGTLLGRSDVDRSHAYSLLCHALGVAFTVGSAERRVPSCGWVGFESVRDTFKAHHKTAYALRKGELDETVDAALQNNAADRAWSTFMSVYGIDKPLCDTPKAIKAQEAKAAKQAAIAAVTPETLKAAQAEAAKLAKARQTAAVKAEREEAAKRVEAAKEALKVQAEAKAAAEAKARAERKRIALSALMEAAKELDVEAIERIVAGLPRVVKGSASA